MACNAREKTGWCVHYQCPFSDQTRGGYDCVEILDGICEVGENCLRHCPYSFQTDLSGIDITGVAVILKPRCFAANDNPRHHPYRCDSGEGCRDDGPQKRIFGNFWNGRARQITREDIADIFEDESQLNIKQSE